MKPKQHYQSPLDGSPQRGGQPQPPHQRQPGKPVIDNRSTRANPQGVSGWLLAAPTCWAGPSILHGKSTMSPRPPHPLPPAAGKTNGNQETTPTHRPSVWSTPTEATPKVARTIAQGRPPQRPRLPPQTEYEEWPSETGQRSRRRPPQPGDMRRQQAPVPTVPRHSCVHIGPTSD